MAAFTTIFAAVAATAAVATAASAISSASAQKSAANRAAATDEENARRAQENAEAWATAQEQQTKFNTGEATLDADIVHERTTRDVAFLGSQRAYQSSVYDRSIASTTSQLVERGDAITRQIGTQSELIGIKRDAIDRQIGTQSAIIALRGDTIGRDAEDEISALLGQSGYERGALTRKAAQTLSEASSAVLAADTRTGFEAANLEASAADLDAASQASLRRAGIEKALGAAEQQRLRAQSDRVVGAVRAEAGKAGVALSGSSADILAEQAGDAELQVLAAKYQNDITVDSYVEDARSKGVRAVQSRTQAGQTRVVGALDAVNTMASAHYAASELTSQATEVQRRAEESIGTLQRKRDTDLQALDIQGRETLGALDAQAKSVDIEGRQTIDTLNTELASTWREGADRVGALDAERSNTAATYDNQILTTRLQGEQQEAAFRREAEQIKIKGEIDARNTRLTQMAAAVDFRNSAASRRDSGSAAQTAGYLSAGATLLKTGAELSKLWTSSTISVPPSTSGAVVGAVEPLTGFVAGGAI